MDSTCPFDSNGRPAQVNLLTPRCARCQPASRCESEIRRLSPATDRNAWQKDLKCTLYTLLLRSDPSV